MNWAFHFLDADRQLAHWIDPIRDQARQAHAKLTEIVGFSEMPPLDIVVEADCRAVIPEIGIGGACFKASRIDLAIDPGNAHLPKSIAHGELRRTLYHEFHHALRWRSAGYGTTLGEALVSEGLAQHFEQAVEGGSAPLTSHPDSAHDWARMTRQAAPLLGREYDHASWFFGGKTDGMTLPRWAGYALGYALVGAFLKVEPKSSAASLRNTNATVIMQKGWQGIGTAFSSPLKADMLPRPAEQPKHIPS